MQLRNSTSHYGTLAVAAHWATALLVIAAWLLGSYGGLLPRGTSREIGLIVHMCMGLAVLLILVPRLIWRLTDQQPVPESTPLGAWGERASTFVHYALYALLLAVPTLGILTQFARGHPLPIFGLFDIASPLPADRTLARSMKDLHGLFADGILILAGLHAGAAIIHHWILRDRTLRRMLPILRPQ
jgi:cytochrome b561